MSQIPQQQPGQYGIETSVPATQQSQFGQQPQLGQQPQFGQATQFGQQPQPSYQVPQGQASTVQTPFMQTPSMQTPAMQTPAMQTPAMQAQLPSVNRGVQQPGASGQQATQADGRQIATTLQELERTLDQANVYALENGNPAVARIAEDLETMTEAERKLILRQSPFAESFRQTLAQNLQRAIQDLHHQPNDAALQELVEKIRQASAALQNGSVQLSASEQGVGQQAQLGQQSQQSQQPQQ